MHVQLCGHMYHLGLSWLKLRKTYFLSFAHCWEISLFLYITYVEKLQKYYFIDVIRNLVGGIRCLY